MILPTEGRLATLRRSVSVAQRFSEALLTALGMSDYISDTARSPAEESR